MKRGSKERDTHDRKVREIARKLRKEGYQVKADIKGYDSPKPIGRYKRKPDIEATSSKGSRRIIEVETPKSLGRDKEQISTFIRHAAQKRGTSLDIVVTKPKKGVRRSSTRRR